MAPVPNRGPELLWVNIFFMTTAVAATSLRCYVRARMVKAFGIDDWLMIFATLSFVSYSSFSNAGVHYGTGRHYHDLPLHGIQKAMKCWWFCYLFYCTSMISSKVSIGFLLLRIAVKKIHAWILYAAMFISVVAGVVFFFVTLFQCKPISYFWNKTQSGKCINIDIIIGLACLYSTFSIISDFTFAILPVFLVWNLQLNRRAKIALIPLLTMGCIASSAVVARVPYLKNFSDPDFLWSTTDIAIWSTVEQGLAITAGSLATLRPLLQLVSHKLGFSTRPTGLRPSNYGIASPPSSNALSSRRKGSEAGLDAYSMSTFAQLDGSETRQEEGEVKTMSPSWYQASFNRGNPMSPSKMKTVSENESEEELRGAQSSKGELVEGPEMWKAAQNFLDMDESK
ncbi:hypothetical protein K469DRAFT_612360 [Zopfia rhizophila CBS 207.26]|uniref:Rhodopsin domain-containing protein n=1 Tax=Zopfia rhizophila CBS 207.26 TaxID=1314779 RepID=A0A6A6D7E3_9PEZI|nr:hypothetical protein K469DRAFT_612360 [Zopfia rhizophila CBS 207.26]